jgi:predicted transcriptional regulator
VTVTDYNSDKMTQSQAKRLRKVDAKKFRRAAKVRGHSLLHLAGEFGVSRRHLYRVLNGEVSRPLVARIWAYMGGEAQ